MSWNDVSTAQNSNGGDKKKAEFVQLKAGNPIIIRVLDDEPKSRWSHWLPSANKGKGASVTCIGKGCPVCAEIKAAQDAKKVKKYGSTKKHSLNVIDRADGTVKILDGGNQLFTQLGTYLSNMGDLKGYDVKIIVNGTGTNTAYVVMPVMTSIRPLTDAEKALEKYNLDELNKPLTAEQIVELMNGKSYAELLSNNETETAEQVQQSPTLMSVDFSNPV